MIRQRLPGEAGPYLINTEAEEPDLKPGYLEDSQLTGERAYTAHYVMHGLEMLCPFVGKWRQGKKRVGAIHAFIGGLYELRRITRLIFHGNPYTNDDYTIGFGDCVPVKTTRKAGCGVRCTVHSPKDKRCLIIIAPSPWAAVEQHVRNYQTAQDQMRMISVPPRHGKTTPKKLKPPPYGDGLGTPSTIG